VTVTTPSTAQVRAQVEQILKRDPQSHIVGIRSRLPQPWPPQLMVDGRNFQVRWCESSLEARQLLIGASSSPTDIVLLTPLSDQDIGIDVLSAFPRGKLISIDGSEALCAAFQARYMDFRLRTKEWMADLLLEGAPPGGYPPVAGGVLDAETAWRHVLQQTLGLTEARPNVEGLLESTITDGAAERFSRLPSNIRDEIATWLSDVSGPAGPLVVSCIAAGHGADALPLGLVCGVIFSDQWTEQELSAAAIRLENYVGRRRVELAAGRAWAEAATSIVRKKDYAAMRPWLERADVLLRDLHVSSFVSMSTVLPSSFEARLIAFAEKLESALNNLGDETLNKLDCAARALIEHHLAKYEELRILRVRMAQRLARWLALKDVKPSSFDRASAAHADGGSYVDWARRVLMSSDENATLSAAYSLVSQRVQARREEHNQAFADFLKHWTESARPSAQIIPIENVLETIIAPLARIVPVLLLAIDGLSYSVFRELAEEFEGLGWLEMIPAGERASLSAIAVLPTLTEISRSSLFAGKITQGNAQAEKTSFASHSALLTVSSRGKPPIVYHKGELQDTAGLSAEIRNTIADTGQRIVGIVINAVDDQLDGADQLHVSWSLDDISFLRAILREARNAARIVVVTSDHGHIVEHGTSYRRAEGGDRWRPATGITAEDEREITGGRVLTPTGAKSAVMLWGERTRFGAKKNGYHGGISPQEVVVPLSVFSPSIPIEGWKDAAPAAPGWWGDVNTAPEITLAMPRVSPPPPKTKDDDLPLFATPPRAKPPTEDWISPLFSSSSYLAQRELASRGAPRDEDVRKVLEALTARGGKMTRVALAQKLDMPLVRMPGVLSAVKRVLNIDQSQVLNVDEAVDVVELNITLLRKQFRLGQSNDT
jgi:PglZ domain